MTKQKATRVGSRQTIWILGGGRFGHLAAQRLGPKALVAAIYVVEKQPQALSAFHDLDRIETIGADAIQFIDQHLMTINAGDWIVPAVPLHVAHNWVTRTLMRSGTVTPLDNYWRLRSQLFNPMQGLDGAIYTSIADFRCPDDCAEPFGYCTITGKPRPAVMHRHLKNLSLPGIATRVIRSQQLAPGVGGYQVQALLDTLAWVKQQTSPMLLATACQCHAVLHTFSFQTCRPNKR
jgi:hypothetical protein